MPRFLNCLRISFALHCLIILAGCKDISWHTHPVKKITIGEAVHEVISRGVAKTNECTSQRLEPLVSRKETFVDAVDYIIPQQLVTSIPDFVSESFLPLVDTNQLPPLSQNAAASLQLLVDDELDPNRTTLEALRRLAKTKSVLQAHHILRLLEAFVHDPKVTDLLAASANLATEHNGVDYAINEVLDLISRHLDSFAQPSTCNGLDIGNLENTLLRTDLLPSSVEHGKPAWLVRTDIHGNPRVATSPDGTLYPPFVDLNQDEAADINENGHPIDANGEVIKIAPIGTDGRRDAEGRALSHQGNLIYDYFDTKRTGLSMLLVLFQEATKTNIHHDSLTLLKAIMGTPQICHDQTSTCRYYPSEDHPVADLLYILIEIARYEHAQNLLNTWSELVNNNPTLAENVLIALGKTITEINQSNVSFLDLEFIELAQKALPLLSAIFQTPNSSQQSTGRLLINLLHQLGQTARDLPQQILTTIEYQSLHLEEACSDSKPDLENSTPVDYSLPRRYIGENNSIVDNRSSLEKSIELFTNVNCGSVPFTGGKSVAKFILETIADMEPDSVCNSIDTLLDVVGVFPWMGETLSTNALDIIGCDGDLVWRDLQTLDSLAKSGALNSYIPIAKIFVERDQIETLLGLFELAATDLKLDEDAELETTSVVRAALPVIADIIKAGALESLFDLVELLLTVPASGNGETAADVIIDSLERLLTYDAPISTRQGIILQTSLAEQTLLPLTQIVSRLSSQESQDALRNISSHITGYLTQTEIDDNNTATSSDDVVVLENKRILPLTQIILDVLAQLLNLQDSQRHCYLTSFQNSGDDYLTGRNFASAIRLLETMTQSDDGRILESALIRYLDLIPEEGFIDVFGPITQVITGMAQMSANGSDIETVISYFAKVLNPGRNDSRQTLTTLNEMVQKDTNNFLLTLARNALYHGENGRHNSAVYEIVAIVLDVWAVKPTNQCLPNDEQWTISEIESQLIGIIDFITDNNYGLGAIWKIIRSRRGGVTTYE